MFVGRTYEKNLLEEALRDRSKAQLVVLYGRRRIGKSTLIRESLRGETNTLFFEGIQGGSTDVQIDQFLKDLSLQTGKIRLAAGNWREVFQGLGELVERGRWVLVFDEFPWLAVGRKQLVSDLKLFWDRWAANKNLVLILCGSVASFMVKHLVHSTALHNRKTLEINLGPLSPREAGLFIPRRSLWEKAGLYMCLGGIPKYLEQIDPRLSLEKNLNRLCFMKDGFFVNEFETLFKEQFRAVKTYETLVEVLATGARSLSDLARNTKIARGGGLLAHLQNLAGAQFVKSCSPHAPSGRQRSRTKIYKLTDPFLIFYFRYIKPNREIISRNRNENLFRSITQSTLHQYYGFAFERLCEDAFDSIRGKIGLDLADILNMGPFFRQSSSLEEGFQIDNLVMRRDGTWTVMEYKFSKKPVSLSVIDDVKQKLRRLRVPSSVSLEKVLVSATGVVSSVTRSRFFDHILTLEDLLQ